MRHLFTLFYLATAASALAARGTCAAPAMTMRAGEWETVVSVPSPLAAGMSTIGRPQLICRRLDRDIDMTVLVAQALGMRGDCSPSDIRADQSGARLSMICPVGSMTMRVQGSVTMDGPDAYTTRARARISGGNGGFTPPDMDVVSVSHRLGPCRRDDQRHAD
jgi:hypothetical protein